MAEAGRIWELSEYEKQRQPHPIITDDTPIAVPPSALQNELLCPICLDVLNQTMTTKACLHRFCRDCIMTAMRNGNKECPTCRKKLQSKRDLHPDATFDALIAKLFPNRAISGCGTELDGPSTSSASNNEPRISSDVSRTLLKKQEEKMAKNSTSMAKTTSAAGSAANTAAVLTSQTNNGASTNSVTKADARKGNAVTSSVNVTSTNEEEEDTDDGDDDDDDDDEDDREVELLLKPLVKPLTGAASTSSASNGTNQETRCLKTTPKATIAHIAKYLALRRQVEADRCTETQVSDDDSGDASCEYEIFAKSRDTARFVALDPASTLRRTADQYAANPPTTPANATASLIKLVLFYKLRREAAGSPVTISDSASASAPKRARNDA